MPGMIPAFYLALSAGNIAVLTFMYGKLGAPAAAVAVPAIAAQRRRVVSKLGMFREMTSVNGPFPRGGHAAGL
ncbi:uncharacterized protein LY89DRAFT_690272 [Mollisia scopiformis]|uniref:Uncharacterized protein n=1 Tax=Mollisia scopiformis TaxID=149040 RepID=A0A132BAD2_MOLSC|nr:uncharacterized protein LY89DRAFT_690272 [Mollisia scopiformis]KUJ09213.1 hypothetical protein LY89DRAFT_690272 [Mollisia scopiformis]